jgi:RHS repeat-associated protein
MKSWSGAFSFASKSLPFIFLFAGFVAFAQTVTPTTITDSNRSGPLPFSQTVGTKIENVDLASGALNLAIPLFSVPGRHLTSGLTLYYTSNIYSVNTIYDSDGDVTSQEWGMNNAGSGWSSNFPTSTSSFIQVLCRVQPLHGAPVYGSYITNFLYTDPSNAQHVMTNQDGGGTSSCQNPGDAGPDLGAQGLWSNSTESAMHSDGSVMNLGANVITDSNGNQQGYSFSSADGAPDSTGRSLYTTTVVSNTDGTPITITYHVPNSSGTTQDYVVHYTEVPVSTDFGSGPQEMNSTTYVPPPMLGVISEIDIPSAPYQKKYLFSYESNYGLLSQITLPDGGIIQYTYSNYVDTSDPYNTGTRRHVSQRTETVGGTSASWQINIPNNQGNSVSSKTTTVTFPDATSHQEVITAGNGVVTDAKIYAGTATGTPLREFAIQYNADVDIMFDTCYHEYAPGEMPLGQATGLRPIQITTTLENGLSSIKTYTYDTLTFTRHTHHCNTAMAATTYTTSRGNVLESDEYDWAPTGTTGALLRRITHTYFNDTASNASAYVAANIVDKIASTIVYNGSGTIVSQNSYTYDDYSGADGSGLTGTTGAPSHNYTTYSTTNTIRGNPTQINRWLNPGGSWLRTSLAYDDLGNVLTQTDPMSRRTTWSYADSWANSSCPVTGTSYAYPTSATIAAGASVAETTRVAYFPCTGAISSSRNPNDIANSRAGTQWTYDSVGRPLSVSLPDGGSSSTTYADYNSGTNPNPSTATTVKVISTSPALSLTTVSEVDGLSRPRKSKSYTSGTGPIIYNRTLYDSLGRVSQQWNPSYCDPDTATSCAADGGTFGFTAHVYDALGRETVFIPPDGTLTANHISTSYSGTSTTMTDQAGVYRTTTTDGLGHLVHVSEGSLGYITQYTYDVAGNLLCVEQHGGVTGTGCSSSPSSDATSPWRVRRFTFDSLSRLLTSKNPETGTISYTYDNDSELTTKTDARSITTTYSPSASPIDSLGRVTQITYSDSTPTVGYTYDSGTNGIGKRTGMTDGSGSAAWTFDPMGRLLSERRTIGSGPGITKTMGATYNLDGSSKTVTYPSGNVVTITPGDHGWPSTVADTSNTYASSLTYGPTGMTTGAAYGTSGLVQANTYNDRLQPVSIKAGLPASPALSLSYDYHLGSADNGNIYAISNANASTRSQTFSYDVLNRLQQAHSSSWGIQFNIDAWGNLIGTSGLTVGGVALTNTMPLPSDLTANLVNQPASSLATFNFTGGNLTQDSAHRYIWDGEDRIASVDGTTTYTYDGDGHRVQKSGSATTLYWGAGPLAESALSGTITSEYIFVGGKRLAKRDIATGAVHYYLSDHLGSSNIVVTSAGVVESNVDFYPYGGENTVTSVQNYKFTGKERDSESGNDYFGARYYASNTGRFMSPDWSAKAEPVPYAKLDNPQSLNLYAYVGNNPESQVDLDGHLAVLTNRFGNPAADEFGLDALHEAEQEQADQEAEAQTVAQQQQSESAQQRAQQPLSSVNVLGRNVGITYGKGLSLTDELAASGKIGAAAGLIDANADSLTASQKTAIGQISSFTVAGPGTFLGATGKGSMTLSAGYIEASSAAWIGSLFGHEGQHYLNAGKYSGDNLWRDEQSAGKTQLGIGNKIGFGSSESRYLEQWIDDRNRTAMQQHMQQGYSY